MKKQIAVVLPALILGCLFLIPAGSATEGLAGTETVLFSIQGEPANLILDGDRLFWLQDSKYVDYSERGIYCYNITGKTRKSIRQIPAPSVRGTWTFGTPVISGNLAVYPEGKPVMLTNISTGQTVQLTNLHDATLPVTGIRFSQNPWIDGDRVVWTEHEEGTNSDMKGGTIVLFNLTTGREQYVPAGMPGNQSYPRISGNHLIWRDYRHEGENNPDLYLFDLMTGTETRLTGPKTMKGIPYIRGDHVIWEENVNGIDTIVHYSVSTGIRSVAGPGWPGQTDAIPPLSGDRIVWKVSKNPLDIREEESAIMVMDLRTGEKIQLTPFRKGLSFPMISGDRIVYTRGAGEDWSRETREVVLFTLPPHPVTVGDTAITGASTENEIPSSSLSGKKSLPPATTPTSSPEFTGMLSIVSLGTGAVIRRIRKKD
ncbi:MAG: hypothetical protein A4E35_01009 [Methanoregula sp. PtaU1.Bin051]|nr:MAG: hypothetical protein A4E35_01009 [Methanoregula sp. PtaU1.Bin051]